MSALDNYYGECEMSFLPDEEKTELLIDKCKEVQKLIYEHNELFKDFPLDLLYTIDVATNCYPGLIRYWDETH